jgi:hypothetical protein
MWSRDEEPVGVYHSHTAHRGLPEPHRHRPRRASPGPLRAGQHPRSTGITRGPSSSGPTGSSDGEVTEEEVAVVRARPPRSPARRTQWPIEVRIPTILRSAPASRRPVTPTGATPGAPDRRPRGATTPGTRGAPRRGTATCRRLSSTSTSTTRDRPLHRWPRGRALDGDQVVVSRRRRRLTGRMTPHGHSGRRRTPLVGCRASPTPTCGCGPSWRTATPPARSRDARP